MVEDDRTLSGKQIISAGDWADCYICEQIFKRKRLTKRYCSNCHNAFCEGEHGNFEGGRVAVCVRCFSSTSIKK